MLYLNFQPAVSVGNIGQLSVDLLISSLHCDKLARLDHPVFVPVVGSDPYDMHEKQDLTTAAERNRYFDKNFPSVDILIICLLCSVH